MYKYDNNTVMSHFSLYIEFAYYIYQVGDDVEMNLLLSYVLLH